MKTDIGDQSKERGTGETDRQKDFFLKTDRDRQSERETDLKT